MALKIKSFKSARKTKKLGEKNWTQLISTSNSSTKDILTTKCVIFIQAERNPFFV